MNLRYLNKMMQLCKHSDPVPIHSLPIWPDYWGATLKVDVVSENIENKV